MGSTPRKILPDNLVQGRIDQDPSVPYGQLGGSQDLCALDDVRLWQLDRFLDQMPMECLPLGIPLWISRPVEIGLVLKHLPEVRIIIESMQRELQLARQRLRKRRLASAACPCDKNMLISTALHLAFFLWNLCRTLRLSCCRKRERSGRCRASAAGG
jgi:CRP-like cAMP-binding protein